MSKYSTTVVHVKPTTQILHETLFESTLSESVEVSWRMSLTIPQSSKVLLSLIILAEAITHNMSCCIWAGTLLQGGSW